MGKGGRKRWRWWLAGAFGLTLAALLSISLWLPSLIRPLGERFGARIESIERADGHYTFSGLSWADPAAGLSFEAKSLTVPTPWSLVVYRFFHSGEPGVVLTGATVTKIAVEGAVPAPPAEASEPPDLPALAREGFDAWTKLDSWIARVAVDGLDVDWEGSAARVDTLELSGGALRVAAVAGEDETTVHAHIAAFRQGIGGMTLTLAVPEVPVELTTEWTVAGEELRLGGALTLAGQSLPLSARWSASGVLPESAALRAQDFVVPPQWASTEPYAAPVIHAALDWQKARGFSFTFDAHADSSDADLPPLTATVRAFGDAESATLETLQVDAWSSQIALSAPLSVRFDDLNATTGARLTLDLNLSAQPVVPAEGRLDGTVDIQHREGRLPIVNVKLAGQGIACAGVTVDALSLDADLDWPRVSRLEFRLDTPDGMRVTADGTAELEQRILEKLTVHAEATGALLETIRPLLGEEELPATFSSLQADVSAEGPFDALAHQGAVSVDGLAASRTAVGDVSLDWRGTMLDFESLDLTLHSDGTEAKLAAAASLGGAERRVTVHAVDVAVEDQPRLSLHAPFTVTLAEGGAVAVSPLQIDSTAGGTLRLSADVDYPRRGKVAFLAERVSSQWLSLVLEDPLPVEAHLGEVRLDAHWDGGPLTAKGRGRVTVSPPDQPVIDLDWSLDAGESGLALEAMNLRQGEVTLLEAAGTLGVTFTPGAEHPLDFVPETPLNFSLHAAPDDALIWHQLESWLGLDFRQPVLSFEGTGTLAAPQGSLRLALDSLVPLGESAKLPDLPPIEDALIELDFSEAQLALTQAKVMISGQALSAQATLPMGESAWESLLLDGAVPDWQEATARLDFSEVPLAAFRPWLPPVLRGEGSFSLRANLEPGQAPRGELTLEGVQTRPLAQLGSINGIAADFRMVWPRLEVVKAEAWVGGEPLTVSGIVDVDEHFAPRLDLKFGGQNVPLARSPGIILRASPDLYLKTDEDGVTTLGGLVKMDESVFTMDLSTIGQAGGGGGASAGGGSARPPFFSIDVEPLASWRLALKIEGDRFLRVRVPAFQGVVSANFDLRGALRDPFMFGQAELEQGVVLFPFGTLRLDQGTVAISQNEPDKPVLDVSASGRAYGYDVQMRVTGTAFEPVLSFTSTPSLEQTDILLMLTSGQIPEQERSTGSRLSGIGMYIGNSFLAELGLIDALDDTLTVNVGEDVSTSGRDTINVRYKINDDWSLVGAYDKYDAYTLDAQWTIYED